jgi:hypothetical protein
MLPLFTVKGLGRLQGTVAGCLAEPPALKTHHEGALLVLVCV